jgi:5-keto 4-deoxyuronate isomerase
MYVSFNKQINIGLLHTQALLQHMSIIIRSQQHGHVVLLYAMQNEQTNERTTIVRTIPSAECARVQVIDGDNEFDPITLTVTMPNATTERQCHIKMYATMIENVQRTYHTLISNETQQAI